MVISVRGYNAKTWAQNRNVVFDFDRKFRSTATSKCFNKPQKVLPDNRTTRIRLLRRAQVYRHSRDASITQPSVRDCERPLSKSKYPPKKRNREYGMRVGIFPGILLQVSFFWFQNQQRPAPSGYLTERLAPNVLPACFTAPASRRRALGDPAAPVRPARASSVAAFARSSARWFHFGELDFDISA